MKLLGKTKNGWIVEMEKDEVAKLAGVHSMYGLEQDQRRNVEAGDKLDVSRMYDEAQATLGAYKSLRDEFKVMQSNLAKLLAQMNPEKP